MAFIVDNYNKYDIWDRQHSRYIFEINGNWYAIKEIELEWGIPVLPTKFDNTSGREYKIYQTYNDALLFVKGMKYLTNH